LIFFIYNKKVQSSVLYCVIRVSRSSADTDKPARRI